MDPSDHWVVFPNAFVNYSLRAARREPRCSPGGSAHHTDVRNNRDGPLLDETQTLAAWLDAAGPTRDSSGST